MSSSPKIVIRPARPDDVPELTALLNQIIERGGTTAYQQVRSEDDFETKFSYLFCVNHSLE